MSGQDEDIHLDEADTIAIIELLSTIVATPGTLSEKRHLLSQGLSHLIDSDVCIWGCTHVNLETGELSPYIYISDGVDMEVISEIQNGRIDHPELHCSPDEPAMLPLLKPGEVVTRSRQQVVSDEDWYSHPHIKIDRLQRLNIDHCLYSAYVNPAGNCFSAIGMHRRPGREPFSARDRRILHVVSTEVWWLHAGFHPDQADLSLFPEIPKRLSKTFNLLMQGRSRADIADKLGLSIHTANDYVKDIYKRFGVSSQSQLLTRFVHGNGNDQ